MSHFPLEIFGQIILLFNFLGKTQLFLMQVSPLQQWHPCFPPFFPMKDNIEGKKINFCDMTTKCILMFLCIMHTFTFQLFTLYFFHVLRYYSQYCIFTVYKCFVPI